MSQALSPRSPRDSAYARPEMTTDAAFAKRIRRLAATSAVALGILWLLAAGTHPSIRFALAAGWVLMPLTLIVSLKVPRLRYGLSVPAALIAGAVTAICVTSLPTDPRAAWGWLLVTGGVWFGGILGAWFWFRWLPVPRILRDPFSPGRWILIAVHVVPIIAGIVLLALAAMA